MINILASSKYIKYKYIYKNIKYGREGKGWDGKTRQRKGGEGDDGKGRERKGEDGMGRGRKGREVKWINSEANESMKRKTWKIVGSSQRPAIFGWVYPPGEITYLKLHFIIMIKYSKKV